MVYIYAFLGRLLLYPYLMFKLSRLLPDSLCRFIGRLFVLEFVLSTLTLCIHRFVMHDAMSMAMTINLYIFFALGYTTAFVMGLNVLQWLGERLGGRRFSEWLSLRQRQGLDIFVALLAIVVASSVLYYGQRNGRDTIVHAYSVGDEAKPPLARIALVTDLHIGEGVGVEHVRQTVDLLMGLQPNAILFGGDYIDHDSKYARDPRVMQEMRRLSAPDGVYFVLGNHEYRADTLDNMQWVWDLGFTLLRDSIVYPEGAAYSIIGRDDYERNGTRASLPELIAQLKPRNYNILLEHTPEGLDSLANTPIDVALYGHTHAGQLWPYEHILKLKYDVPYGYAKRGDCSVIVSSGVGAAGTLFRIGTRSEIVLLTLYPKEHNGKRY